MDIMTINKDNFDKEVLQAEKPVVLDFWARGAATAADWGRWWTVWRHSMKESFWWARLISMRVRNWRRSTRSRRSRH